MSEFNPILPSSLTQSLPGVKKAEAPTTRIIYRSEAMGKLLKMVERVAPSQACVLVLGESGTGKELIARATHTYSLRQDKEFITVDCSALVETLLESELFGHVKGSFTGAIQTKYGSFELANGGTFFFDEIGNLSLDIHGIDTARIALQRSAYTLEYFADSGWTDRAPEMVQTLLGNSFESTGKIVGVGMESIGIRPDYLLKTDLREFRPSIPKAATSRTCMCVLRLSARAHAGSAHRSLGFAGGKDRYAWAQFLRHYRCVRRGARESAARYCGLHTDQGPGGNFV